jgi:organic radical activating enzyme
VSGKTRLTAPHGQKWLQDVFATGTLDDVKAIFEKNPNNFEALNAGIAQIAAEKKKFDDVSTAAAHIASAVSPADKKAAQETFAQKVKQTQEELEPILAYAKSLAQDKQVDVLAGVAEQMRAMTANYEQMTKLQREKHFALMDQVVSLGSAIESRGGTPTPAEQKIIDAMTDLMKNKPTVGGKTPDAILKLLGEK